MISCSGTGKDRLAKDHAEKCLGELGVGPGIALTVAFHCVLQQMLFLALLINLEDCQDQWYFTITKEFWCSSIHAENSFICRYLFICPSSSSVCRVTWSLQCACFQRTLTVMTCQLSGAWMCQIRIFWFIIVVYFVLMGVPLES